MHFNISIFTVPPLDESVGRIEVKQVIRCQKDQVMCEKERKTIPTSNCTDDYKAEKYNFWSTRLGYLNEQIFDGIQCADYDSMYINSTSYLPDYEAIQIKFYNCIEYS